MPSQCWDWIRDKFDCDHKAVWRVYLFDRSVFDRSATYAEHLCIFISAQHQASPFVTTRRSTVRSQFAEHLANGMRAAHRGKRPVGPATMTNDISAPLALRPREAARMLSISPRTLWEWTRAGIIPCARVGTGKRRTVLYSVLDLQAWLTQRASVTTGGNHDPR